MRKLFPSCLFLRFFLRLDCLCFQCLPDFDILERLSSLVLEKKTRKECGAALRFEVFFLPTLFPV